MYVYKYEACDRRGHHVQGTLTAHSEEHALHQLKEKYYKNIEISRHVQQLPPDGIFKKYFYRLTRRVSDQTLLVFTKEVALMLNAGIGFQRAIKVLAGHQKEENMKNVLASIHASISSGCQISYSLEKHQEIFPPIYRALVRIGEASGQLPAILEELYAYQEKGYKMKRKIISALTYPLFVMGSTVVILTALMAYYVPSFTKFLVEMRIQLPVTTRILVTIVSILQSPSTIPILVLIIVVSYYLYHNFKTTLVGRYFLDTVKIRIPIIGEIIILLNMIRFANAFALMYRHGVQILDIVDASARLVQMEPIKDLMIQCRSEISEGMSLSQSLGTKKYIPPLMQSFLLLGEETDDMVTPMEKLSEIYDNQVTYQIDCLISLVEPVFMTFSAILVGFVGLSLFLPVYSVISSMGV